jgi:AcrR family transcriptional regulator
VGRVDDLDQPVFGDDRALILSAAARLGASDGYGELSIPRIRAAAGVSRKSFDEHFDGVKDCFLDALELRTVQALAGAAHRSAGSGTWPARVYRTVAGLCSHIARDPMRARAVFVEVFAAGPDGVRCRARLVTDVAEYFRATAPPDQRPTELAAEASVGAVWGILHHQIVTGRAQQVPGIAATLSYLLLAPAIGAPAVVQAITEARARADSGSEANGTRPRPTTRYGSNVRLTASRPV